MSITLDDAMALITLEADLLDHGQFHDWLALYTPEAKYIVPVDPDEENFEATLNYAYDDAAMRRKRVERLLGGRSISAAPPARTIRLLGRARMLEDGAASCTVRCAQLLKELRQHRVRDYAANLTYRLARTPEGLKIDRKVIRLLDATEALTAVSYIL
ncbi:MAG: aromatic-ring-hydroxylating dioxygenase subunit beta [Gluconacetobacter liquefaciens]